MVNIWESTKIMYKIIDHSGEMNTITKVCWDPTKVFT